MKKDFKIHSVKYNFIMNIILKMSSFLFPMITFPYVSRVLQASGNGKIAFASSVIYYFTLFGSLGIPTYGIKVCAQVRDNKEELSRTVHELLLINIFCVIVSYLCFIIMMLTVPKFSEEPTLLWINSISIPLSALGVEWFYQAIEQYDYITFRNILFKIISIILMFVFVNDIDDYIVYGAITILGTVGSNILNLLKLPKYIYFNNLKNYNFKVHFKPIALLFLYTAATSVYTNLDTIMLGFICGETEVGYYNVAVKLKGILVSVITALGAVMMPRMAYILKNEDKDEFVKMIKDSFEFIFIISLPIIFYLIYEAKNIIIFLAGSAYYPAIPSMKIVMITLLFIGIGSVTALQILIPLGKNSVTVVGAIIGGTVDLIINFLLIPKIGSSGAAIGTLMAECAVVLIHFISLKDFLSNLKINKDIFKIFFSAVISTIMISMVKQIVLISNVFMSLVFSSLLYFVTYALLLIVLKENFIYNNSSKLIKRLKNN